MIRRVLLFALIAAAILGLIWLLRRSRATGGKAKDLKGCLGVAEDALKPGEEGRVRVMDREGNPVILSALLDGTTPSAIEKGTKVIVVNNGADGNPPTVTVVDLPGDSD